MKAILIVICAVLSAVLLRSMLNSGPILKLGDVAPDFDLPDAQNAHYRRSDFLGHWLVLYFYPKDDTPGCTKEACAFRDDWVKLEKLGAKVVGVSVDNANSHARFAEKYHLPFPLLADENGAVASHYGALYDFGLIKFAKRYTFLIAPDGKLVKTYRDVDASRHSVEIIDDLEKLKKLP